MDQDEPAVVDLTEVNTGQGGEATAAAAVLAGEVAGAEDRERISEVDSSVRGAASQSAKRQDLEEPSPESDEVAEASERIEKGDGEAFDNPAPIATPLEFRSAAADATPAPILMRFTAAGHAEQAGSEAAVLGAPSSSAPAPASQGAAPGDHRNLRQAGSAPGARWAIAHASPRDSYRRMPSRRRKQYPPKKRFVATAAGASSLAAAPPARDPAPQALPSASASERREASDDDTASSASSSKRPPSRSRKQPRSAHIIREEAEATASAKARRSPRLSGPPLSGLSLGVGEERHGG